MTNQIVISSWSEFMDRLFDDSWDPKLLRHRSPYAFRGLSDEAYHLKTTLMRLGGNFEELEKHLLRNFRKFAHRTAVQFDSVWNWLTLAEHHGLPTRLLDWTFSPFVAAHFATCDFENFSVNGIVWCVNFIEVNKLLPEKLKSFLIEDDALMLTVEMLNKAVKSLNDFDNLSPSEFVAFFEPPSLDERVINQYGIFSVMSNSKALLDEWLTRHPSLYRKIIIPASLKQEIRDKLDKANINERVLFPGLDGLASWLKRYYSPAHYSMTP